MLRIYYENKLFSFDGTRDESLALFLELRGYESFDYFLDDCLYSEYEDSYIHDSTCDWSDILDRFGNSVDVGLDDSLLYDCSMTACDYPFYGFISDDYAIVTEDTGRSYPMYSDWASDNLYHCEECGDWFEHDTSGRYIDGYWYCNDCAPERPVIYDYHGYDGSYKERFLNSGSPEDDIPVGFELEVDNVECDNEELADDALETVNADDDYFPCEYDSSVDFEFISQPMTLALHKKLDYDNTLLDALRGRCQSHDAGTCGLHVHVSKRDLSDKALERIRVILEFFKPELFTFSRRQSWTYQYASFGDRTPKDGLKLVDVKGKTYAGHYTYYNEESGSTIEFRLFRGTLKGSTLYASLELVRNIVNIAKAEHIKKISWSDLLTGEYCAGYSRSRGIICNAVLDFEKLESEYMSLCEAFHQKVHELIEKTPLGSDVLVAYIRQNAEPEADIYAVPKSRAEDALLEPGRLWRLDWAHHYMHLTANNIDRVLGGAQ